MTTTRRLHDDVNGPCETCQRHTWHEIVATHRDGKRGEIWNDLKCHVCEETVRVFVSKMLTDDEREKVRQEDEKWRREIVAEVRGNPEAMESLTVAYNAARIGWCRACGEERMARDDGLCDDCGVEADERAS